MTLLDQFWAHAYGVHGAAIFILVDLGLNNINAGVCGGFGLVRNIANYSRM